MATTPPLPPAQPRPAEPRPAESPPCVFDQVATGALAADLVLDESDVLGFLDHHPLFPGHTLVIPRVHLATISELPPDLSALLFDAARRVAAAQRVALGSQGTFLGLNDIVSQSVPHVHIHVVPRTRGDGLRGFFWPRTRYPDAASSAAVAARLRDALGSA
jgi:histidine triad (HIT) family protein